MTSNRGEEQKTERTEEEVVKPEQENENEEPKTRPKSSIVWRGGLPWYEGVPLVE